MPSLKALLVQLAAPGARSTDGGVPHAAAATPRFRLSIDQIRAQRGSLLDQLTEEEGDGAAGLAIEMAGDMGIVRVPHRDPPLFAFAMEAYRLGLQPALSCARPAGYTLAQLAAELGYWQLAAPGQLEDQLLAAVALGLQGAAADIEAVREALTERLWGQMRLGMRARWQDALLSALARADRALWAFVLAGPAGGRDQAQGRGCSDRAAPLMLSTSAWLLQSQRLLDELLAVRNDSNDSYGAAIAGISYPVDYLAQVAAHDCSRMGSGGCTAGPEPLPEPEPLRGTLARRVRVEQHSCLLRDLRSRAARDGYGLALVYDRWCLLVSYKPDCQ